MFGGILNDKNATQPAKVENDTSTSIQTTVPVTPISAAGNAAEISNKRAAPDAEEDEDLKRQKLTQETVTNVLSEAVGNAVKQIPASGTVASPKISIQPPSPSRTSSPRKTGSPKKAMSPVKAQSPTKAMSPTKAQSPKKAMSPTKAQSPKKAMSPTRAQSPKKAMSPEKALSPKAQSPKKVMSPKKLSSPKKTVAPLSSEPVPVLMGDYKVDYGVASWKGLWGFEEESFKSGQTSSFTFKSRSSAGAVSLNGPINGLYDGFFMFRVPKGVPQRIEERGLQLTFTKQDNDPNTYSVIGKGTNRFGAFILQGKLCGSELKVTKEYTS